MTMQLSHHLGDTRLLSPMLSLFALLLITAPPGGHSLHLAAAPNTAGLSNMLDIASETTMFTNIEQTVKDLNDIWKNLETIRTTFTKRTHLPPSNLQEQQLAKQNLKKESLLTAASATLEGPGRVEPLASKADSSVVFVAVFCSLMGSVLAVLLLVFGFVVWREAYEVSERERKLRDPAPPVEESAYTAFPRDNSPSNFPPVYSQPPREKDAGPHVVVDAITLPGPAFLPQPTAPVHSDQEYRRSRSILRTDRQHPKKVVRLQVPPVSTAPSIGNRYTQYDVAGIELSDAQKWHRMEVSRRAHRY